MRRVVLNKVWLGFSRSSTYSIPNFVATLRHWKYPVPPWPGGKTGALWFPWLPFTLLTGSDIMQPINQ